MIETRGAAIAASVAAMFAAQGCSSKASPAVSGDAGQSQQGLVKCEGVNECKAQSECKSRDGKSGCQGLNDCKGQGWITITSEECTQKGGKVLAAAGDGGATSTADSGPKAGSTTTPTAFKCSGINTCQGTSECAAKDGSSSCAGKNSCAGKGWITVPTEAACTSKGGKLVT